MATHQDKPGYHHGDLRATLLREADQLLREDGIGGMSLRKLAERIGVSRMAPYHHFRDKNALLSALAEEGFRDLKTMIDNARLGSGNDPAEGLRDFVRDYLRFATDHPERYELMFGRPLWKSGQPTDALRETAFAAFRHYADRIAGLLQHGTLPQGSKPLRLAQASWATLHGLCKLLNDGIYVDRQDMEEVSEEAVRLMLAALR
ncbi:TetR/AcrR family transcriptional regulator [Isoalcanivorax indicus]|uniref:TetR/AcrR family transcriptional regulator n=1 Tax=Isoalcanivorax indicus TaxID=2202653 RepID=UPI000DB9AEAA|nr:TetR/AcrR family transcriptional regulator [Isoalcanivorax indicus]